MRGGSVQSHRIVQSHCRLTRVLAVPLPDTRYMLHVLYTVYCILYSIMISIPVTRTRSVHSGVHTLQRPPPAAAAAAAQLCPMGLTLSVLTYTISTSILHERLTYVLNFLKLCFWQCTDREGASWGGNEYVHDSTENFMRHARAALCAAVRREFK